MIVSTSLKSRYEDKVIAVSFAQSLAIPFVEREHYSLDQLRERYQSSTVVIFEQQQPIAYHGDERFFFHRGMSELRLLNMIRGGTDSMVEAMGLEPGMKVLDCTVGLAADALVAAYAVTETGIVIGLESVPLVAAISRRGVKCLAADSTVKLIELKLAAQKVEVVTDDHFSYLAGLPDNCFDIVYFDPMFRHPKKASTGIHSLRGFADARSLDRESISQALRVARSRVVIKETAGSPEFVRLGIRHLAGGQYSSVHYGILFKEERM